MTTYLPLPHRLAASSLLALAAIISVPQAQAFSNNHVVPTDQSPDWSVFLSENCSGTQITPHVLITTARCLKLSDSPLLYYPKAMTFTAPFDAAVYSGPDATTISASTLALIVEERSFDLFEQGAQTANILSYAAEKQLLVDGNDALTTGTRFSFYSTTAGTDFAARNVTSTDWYFDKYASPGPDGRPLIYRSVSKYHQLEPGRFSLTSTNPIFTSHLRQYLYDEQHFTDQQINSFLLLSAGLEDDPANGISNPVQETDAGGGIFYKDHSNTSYLLGLLTAGNFHVRLSHYWPWVYQQTMSKGLREDAIALSRKVLGTGAWGTNDRIGKVGDIYVYDNPYTGDVEFFRLKAVGSDQRYWYFPIDKTNDYYWQYLGTSLPTFEHATTGSDPAAVVDPQPPLTTSKPISVSGPITVVEPEPPLITSKPISVSGPITVVEPEPPLTTSKPASISGPITVVEPEPPLITSKPISGSGLITVVEPEPPLKTSKPATLNELTIRGAAEQADGISVPATTPGTVSTGTSRAVGVQILNTKP